jgi:hypothetical protein
MTNELIFDVDEVPADAEIGEHIAWFYCPRNVSLPKIHQQWRHLLMMPDRLLGHPFVGRA